MELENSNQNPNSNLNNCGGKKMMCMYVIVFIVVALAIFVVYEIFKIKTVSQPIDSGISNLETQSPSDNIPDIEKDLNSTDLNSLDSGLQDIDSSL